MAVFSGGIAAGGDADELANNTDFSHSRTTMACVHSTSFAIRRHMGMIWKSTGILSGATITAASITFKTPTSGRMEGFIYGHDVDAPGDFVATTDVTDRVLTTANVAWNENMPNFVLHTSPQFVAVVQELVDRGGFNGDICIIIRGGVLAPDESASFYTENHTTQPTPVLDVTYTNPPPPPLVSVSPASEMSKRVMLGI